MTDDLDAVATRVRTALHEVALQITMDSHHEVVGLSARRSRRSRWQLAVAAVTVAGVVAVGAVLLGRTQDGDRIQVPAGAPVEVAPDRLATEDADLTVFMTVDATDNEIASVRARIAAATGVEQFAYIDKKAALADFRRRFADDPDLVENITPEALPTSFRVLVVSPHASHTLKETLTGQTGVDGVQTRQDVVASQAAEDRFLQGVDDGASLEAFLAVDIDDDEIARAIAEVEALPGVDAVTLYDRVAVLDRRRAADPGTYDAVPSAAVAPSIRIVLGGGVSPTAVRGQVGRVPAIADVRTID